MEKRDVIITVTRFIIGFIILGLIIFFTCNVNNKNNNEVVPDTTYNKIILDSIEYNIIKKDSVIYNIKKKMKDEVTESFELSDSAAVKLFKKLCTAP